MDDVSAFDVLDWQHFNKLIKDVSVKEAVAEVNEKKAVAAVVWEKSCHDFDMSDWQTFVQSLEKNGDNVIDALTEVLKNKDAQKNPTCAVLEENDPATGSTIRAEAMVFDAYMARGYELEAEMKEAKKEFEEQVELQDVKKSSLELGPTEF